MSGNTTKEQCYDIILARADQARRLLAMARDASDAKKIADMAHAAEVYAKRQKASQDCIDYAHGIKIDALTLLGAFLHSTEKNTGARGIGKSVLPKKKDTPKKLVECGINEKESSISQRLYKLSLDQPEKHKLIRDAKEPITSVFSSAHVSNNSGNNEWYTPQEIIVAATEVLERIDLDPASTVEANAVVKAKCFYTKNDDGLSKEWKGRVWMNPPYAGELVGSFVRKLINHVEEREVEQAIVLVNNCTETKWFQELAIASRCICFPAARIKFWHPAQFNAAPLQGQAILGMRVQSTAFIEAFRKIGFCCRVI